MFCKRCGKEITEETKFCPYCGSQNNVQLKVEDTKKQRKESHILPIPLIVGIVVCVAVIMWWINSSHRIYYHLVYGNIDKANELYIEKFESLDDHNGKLYKMIERGVDTTYQKYYEEKKEAEEAIEFLNRLDILGEEQISSLTNPKKKEIMEIQESRNAYQEGIELVEKEKYMEAIAEFDRVIEADSYYEKAQKEREIVIVKAKEQTLVQVKEYRENKDYERAVEVVNKALDFMADETELQELKKVCEDEALLYEIVCEFEKEDYDKLMEIGISEEVKSFVEEMEEDKYFFLPDGDPVEKTGKGLGIYDFGEDYWFYYGDLVEGIREGNGRWYAKRADMVENAYMLYEGEWINDYPNGEGSWHDFFDYDRPFVHKGKFVDGKIDGKMLLSWVDGKNVYHVKYNAIKGVPTQIPDENIPEEYRRYIESGDTYIFGFSEEKEESGIASQCMYIDYGGSIYVPYVTH